MAAARCREPPPDARIATRLIGVVCRAWTSSSRRSSARSSRSRGSSPPPRSSHTRPTGTARTRSRASCSTSSPNWACSASACRRAHGGAGADFLSYILVLEELSRADAGVGVTVAVHTSACTLPILAFGSDDAGRPLRPAARARRADRLLCAHRAGRRVRCRVARHVGGGDGRRLAHPRDEAVDHERGVRRPAAAVRAHRPGHSHRARCVRVRRRRRARRGDAHRGEARPQLVGHERHRSRYASSPPIG